MNSSLLHRVRTLSGLRRKYLGEQPFLYCAAVLIGLFAGAASALLKWGIDWLFRTVFDDLDRSSAHWIFLIVPFLGLLLSGLFTRYVIRIPMDNGTERLTADMKVGRLRFRSRLMVGPLAACTITLGLGGSGGTSGAIAFAGGAIGSNVGRMFRLPKTAIYDLVGIGGAAGIAGIFMAPIGGVMFALEVLRMKISWRSAIPLILSAMAASLTASLMLHSLTDVYFFAQPSTFDYATLPYVMLCGLLCGLYGVYYKSVVIWCRRYFGAITNVWRRSAIGGAILAILILLFPSLYGEGFSILHSLIDGRGMSLIDYGPLARFGTDYDTLLILIGVLLFAKPWASSATNEAGGVGGHFTPTLFSGAVAGFLFVSVANHAFGLQLSVELFTFFGMAAVMSAVMSAPLMAIFLCAEMAGQYTLLLPLAAIVLVCYPTFRLIYRYGVTPGHTPPRPTT